MLYRLAELMERDVEQLAALESLDVGMFASPYLFHAPR